MLSFQQICASILHGSAIGPVFYVVNASDLLNATPGSRMYKYADDTYIVIPSSNVQSRQVQLVADWAQANNLKLSSAKCTEIIISVSRRKPQFNPPPTLSCRVTTIKVLRVTITIVICQSAITSVMSSLSARSLCMH